MGAGWSLHRHRLMGACKSLHRPRLTSRTGGLSATTIFIGLTDGSHSRTEDSVDEPKGGDAEVGLPLEPASTGQ
ncbi:hypothetical protein MRX96_003526 [Rhipicephalus microplus]